MTFAFAAKRRQQLSKNLDTYVTCSRFTTRITHSRRHMDRNEKFATFAHARHQGAHVIEEGRAEQV